MIVRKPQPAEFDTVVNLFNYLLDELSVEEFDEDCLVDNIRAMMVGVEYLFFVAFENSRPVGFIGGYASSKDLWTKATSLHISTAYLLKSHRTQSNFNALFEKTLEWARETELTEITAQTSVISEFNEFLSVLDFTSESHYIKGL